eukprot:CAMPEP_0183482568 /NCGR_PEP_ID=MMETSP0370-20130417/176865_1 /TAXON_ID=268820 /ORGANISM="Peridinium aciculiferum, Strain PAER-2" /LENGTH=94 /DNA_ID=CAMNT_0025675765 /DNA_START=274 /DNA_END=558 /DNA_ORIENTATION=-
MPAAQVLHADLQAVVVLPSMAFSALPSLEVATTAAHLIAASLQPGSLWNVTSTMPHGAVVASALTRANVSSPLTSQTSTFAPSGFTPSRDLVCT